MKLSRTLCEFTEGDIPVSWHCPNRGNSHVIIYGAHIRRYTNSLEAAHQFGECVRHSLECAGKLDEDYDER